MVGLKAVLAHQQICNPMLTCKRGRKMAPTKFPHQRLIPEDELRRMLSPEALRSLKTLDDFADAIWPAIVKLFEARRGSSHTAIPLDRDVAVALEVLVLRLDNVVIRALRLRKVTVWFTSLSLHCASTGG